MSQNNEMVLPGRPQNAGLSTDDLNRQQYLSRLSENMSQNNEMVLPRRSQNAVVNTDESNRQQYLSHLSENTNHQQRFGDVNASLTNESVYRNAEQYVNGLYSANMPEGNCRQVFGNDNE